MTSGSTRHPGSTAGGTGATTPNEVSLPPVGDLDKVPKFDEVRRAIGDPRVLRWLDRLERWCSASVDERDAESARGAQDSQLIDGMMRELADQRDAEQLLAEVRERLADTLRGLHTWEQTAEWIERNV